MRGRILAASLLGLVLVGACSRKDSLYIDTSKDGPAPVEPAARTPAEPAALKPAEPAAKPADGGPPASQPPPKS